jgi:O-antigen/teichoic acid export membrane protein
VGLFRLLPDLGMSYASTLAISREPARAGGLVGNLLGLQVLLSAATLLLCLGIGALLFDGVTWLAVVVLSFDLVLKAVKSTLRFLLKGLERFGAEAVSLLAERALILALGIAALLGGYGVIGFVLVFALVRSVDTAALALYVHRRVVPLRPAADRAQWRELFVKGLPFAYAGAMIVLFFQIDQVLLEQLRGPLEVGWYAAPVRVLEGLTLVPRVLGYALIPTMAALYPAAVESVTALYARGSKYLLVAGLPIGVFGALAAEPFMRFLFGDAYAPSAAAARLLIPSAAFMFLSNFGETTLACVNRWGTIVTVSTLCLLLNVGLNLALIPSHGYIGAAWATLATESCYFAAGAIALRVYGHRIGWLRLLVRPLLATLVFTLVLLLARGLPLLAASCLASAAFLVSTLLLGIWDRKEWEALRGLLRGEGAS